MNVPLKEALGELMQTMTNDAVAVAQKRQDSQNRLERSGQTPLIFADQSAPPGGEEEVSGMVYGQSYGSRAYGEE